MAHDVLAAFLTALVAMQTQAVPARIAGETKARLSAWKPGMPVPAEVRDDVFLQILQQTVTRKQDQKLSLMRENGYGETHPAIAAINEEIAALSTPLNSRIKTLVDDYVQKLPTLPPTLIDGCTATGMTLKLGAVFGVAGPLK